MEVNWEAFRRKKVFLTGGSGFIGKWLIKMFLEQNQELALRAELYALSRPSSENRLTLELREICDRDLSALILVPGECGTFQMPPCDYFIHAAVPRGDMREWTMMHYEQAVGDMAHVLGQAKQAGVKRFLFLSSGLVDTDITPDDPRYLYYITKLSQENLMYHFRRDMECVSARIYSVLGYGMDPHYAAAQFIRQALEDKQVTYQGQNSPLRSYIYVEDLTHSIFESLSSEDYFKLKHFDGYHIRLEYLAVKIASFFEVPFKYEGEQDTEDNYDLTHSPRLVGSSNKIDDAIAKTCALYQKHYVTSNT